MKKVIISAGENIHVAGRDIHIHQEQSQKEKISAPSASQELSLRHIKEILVNFILIFPEACFFKPSKLVDRCRRSKSFNFDSILVVLISVGIVVATFRYYFNSFKMYTETLNMPPALIHFFVNQLIELGKLSDSVISLQLLFMIFRFSVFSFIIPWVIYIKIFKGTAAIYEIMNFQFYFMYSWLPLICWFLLVDVNMTLHNADKTFFWLTMICGGSWFVGRYLVGFNKLMGFTFKKGIIPFILYVTVLAWFVKTF